MDYDDYPDGVIIAGPDGVVDYVNPRIRVMARAEGDEMLGMHLSEAVPFDDLNGNSWYDCVQPYHGLNIRNRISEASWWSPKGSEYLITATLVRHSAAGPVQRSSSACATPGSATSATVSAPTWWRPSPTSSAHL
jgi:PAS domain-containing protein